MLSSTFGGGGGSGDVAHGGRFSSLLLAPSWRVLSSDELVSLIAAAAAAR